MPTDKTAIAEALATLDHTNDELWTDDGAPKVEVIKHLCNDDKITRAQINEAQPGFMRKSTTAIDEDTQAPVETKVATPPDQFPNGNEPPEVTAGGDDELEDLVNFSGNDEDLKAIAQRRIDDAADNLTEKRKASDQAVRDLRAAEARHSRALALYAAKFPPISAAENIKQHLARQQEVLREKVLGVAPARMNPMDAVLQDRKRDNGRNKQRAVA